MSYRFIYASWAFKVSVQVCGGVWAILWQGFGNFQWLLTHS